MPSRTALILARIYYSLAGLIAAAAAAAAIGSAVVAAATGCVVVFSQDGFVNPPTTGPLPDSFPLCQQYVDLLSIGIQLALAAALLLTAWRYERRDRASTTLVVGGGLIGIGVGALPGYLLWWLMDYYNQTAGPVEITIALLPLVAGLLAAWVTWRVLGDRRHSRVATP